MRGRLNLDGGTLKLDGGQARSQKFAMGGAVLGVWEWSPQTPEANGGVGAKPPAAGGWGLGAKSPAGGGTA